MKINKKNFNIKIDSDFIIVFKGDKEFFKVSNNIHNAHQLLMLLER